VQVSLQTNSLTKSLAFLISSVLLLSLSQGCSKSASEKPQNTKTIEFKTKSHTLRLPLPHAWQETKQGLARIYAGPKDTSDYYTTVGIQPFSSSDLSLKEALQVAYEAEKEFQSILWHQRDDISHQKIPALHYKVEFLFYEMPRLRTGILLDLGTQLLDISYTAPKDMFSGNQKVFEHLLKNLEVVALEPTAKS